MSDAVKELLSDQYKGLYKSKGVLTYLFRHVLSWRQINQFNWKDRAKKFAEKPHNLKNRDIGNLNKKLVRDEFTWTNFREAVDFLNPVSATFGVELTWKDGHTSTYSFKIDPAIQEWDTDVLTEGEVPAENEVLYSRPPAISSLAKLYRTIIAKEGIDMEKWEQLLHNHATSPISQHAVSKRSVRDQVTQLHRSLLSDDLSWKKFRLGIDVLDAEKVTYYLELLWNARTGEKSTHRCTPPNPNALLLKQDPADEA
jgi:hypothetical protein